MIVHASIHVKDGDTASTETLSTSHGTFQLVRIGTQAAIHFCSSAHALAVLGPIVDKLRSDTSQAGQP